MDEKEQTRGKQIFVGLPRNGWAQKEIGQTGFARFLPVCLIWFVLWVRVMLPSFQVIVGI